MLYNKKTLFLFTLIPVITSITTLVGMNLTRQDIQNTKDGSLTKDQFSALQQVRTTQGNTIGDLWLNMSYEQYNDATQLTRDQFAQVVEQKPATPIQPPTLVTIRDTQTPKPKPGALQTVGLFLKSLTPWSSTNPHTATPINTDIEQEVIHNPLDASQGTQKIPGTSLSMPIPASVQTIKNNISHNQLGSNIAATVLPLATSTVERVGHHIENNKAAFGTEASLITDANPLSWGGWFVKQASNATYMGAHVKTAASDFVEGKPKVAEDNEYEKLRATHKEKLRAQFTGTDEEFETFFSSSPTPVQGTVLDRPYRGASLVDGVVAGLNDLTRNITHTARLLNSPDIKNAYAASRRINTTFKKPTSFEHALTIIHAINQACTHSITPQELLRLEQQPDQQLQHLIWTTLHISKLCEDLHLTVGNIKEYAHACKTILETIALYNPEFSDDNQISTIDNFINSFASIHNNVHAVTLAHSESKGLSSIEILQGYVDKILGKLMSTEQTRPRHFSKALTIVCKHINSANKLNYTDQNLWDNFITYSNVSMFDTLCKNLFTYQITSPELIKLVQETILASVNIDTICAKKISTLRDCCLFDLDDFTHQGTDINQLVAQMPDQSQEHTIATAILNCAHEIEHLRQRWNNPTTDQIRAIITQQITTLEQLDYTRHQDLNLRDLMWNYRLVRSIRKELHDEATQLQALKDLAGYYVHILEPFITFSTILSTRTNENEHIPNPPAPPKPSKLKPLVIKRKDTRTLIDRGLDAAADNIADGADYLVEHGPEIAENAARRLNNADDEAYRARRRGAGPVGTAYAYAQGLAAAPVDNPPAPPAVLAYDNTLDTIHNVDDLDNAPDQRNSISAHDLHQWRINKGKNPQDIPVAISYPWPNRQEMGQTKEYKLNVALKNNITIQDDKSGNNFIRENQFKYENLNPTPSMPRITPSVWSQAQDKYLEGAVRLGYIGDLLLAAGVTWGLYTLYIKSSYYQIKIVETIEKQCQHGMRNLRAAKTSFEVPPLIDAGTLTRLSQEEAVLLNGALARTRQALKSAQEELRTFIEIPANYQELASILEADRAVSELITLIKKYKEQIKQKRGFFDTGFSSCAFGLAKAIQAVSTVSA